MITAAHCVEHGAVPFTINHRGNTYRVSEQRPLKCYTDKSDEGFDIQFPADLAVLVLDTAIPNAEPGEDYLELWDVEKYGDMTGKTFTLIGWGLSGPVGSPYDGSMSVLHQAENVVNTIEDNTLIYTFDRGDEGGLPKEGLGNSGDSGSPAIIRNPDTGRWNIAGVKSWGMGEGYGSTNGYIRLGGIANNWVRRNIEFRDDGEPAEWWRIPDDKCELFLPEGYVDYSDPAGDDDDWWNDSDYDWSDDDDAAGGDGGNGGNGEGGCTCTCTCNVDCDGNHDGGIETDDNPDNIDTDDAPPPASGPDNVETEDDVPPGTGEDEGTDGGAVVPPVDTGDEGDNEGDNGEGGESPQCVDTSNGKKDEYGDGCELYHGNEEAWCGEYDADGFVSNTMCCACGGGSTGGSAGGDGTNTPDGTGEGGADGSTTDGEINWDEVCVTECDCGMDDDEATIACWDGCTECWDNAII